MTTKELLALVGKWRGLADERMAMYEPNDYRLCADELAPIAAALCAEVEALQHQGEAARAFFPEISTGIGMVKLAVMSGDIEAAQKAADAMSEACTIYRDAIRAARSRNEHEG